MASFDGVHWSFVYLNPDGTFTDSAFKAHFDAQTFVRIDDNPNVLIPPHFAFGNGFGAWM